MKTLVATSLVFLAGLTACATGARIAPVIDVPVQETCREHIVAEPKVTLADWPMRARGKETRAYVVITYDLDGSGKSSNAKVTDSMPSGLFDKTALGLLKRTTFKPGEQATGCVNVRTFGAVKRFEG